MYLRPRCRHIERRIQPHRLIVIVVNARRISEGRMMIFQRGRMSRVMAVDDVGMMTVRRLCDVQVLRRQQRQAQ
jgi:hypothetical protein